jgi:hypothetical protein
MSQPSTSEWNSSGNVCSRCKRLARALEFGEDLPCQRFFLSQGGAGGDEHRGAPFEHHEGVACKALGTRGTEIGGISQARDVRRGRAILDELMLAGSKTGGICPCVEVDDNRVGIGVEAVAADRDRVSALGDRR